MDKYIQQSLLYAPICGFSSSYRFNSYSISIEPRMGGHTFPLNMRQGQASSFLEDNNLIL